MPDLVEGVLIDGYTQPGATPNAAASSFNAVLKIVLEPGTPYNNGLTLDFQNSIMRGLAPGYFGTAITVRGTGHAIDFHASMAPDPTGRGVGKPQLGSTTVTTDGAGNGTFSLGVPRRDRAAPHRHGHGSGRQHFGVFGGLPGGEHATGSGTSAIRRWTGCARWPIHWGATNGSNTVTAAGRCAAILPTVQPQPSLTTAGRA